MTDAPAPEPAPDDTPKPPEVNAEPHEGRDRAIAIVKERLVEHSASAPMHDTDTLAESIVHALETDALTSDVVADDETTEAATE